MQLQFMCWGHTHQYREVRESLSVQEFFGQANPFRSMLGRGPEGGLAAETVETTARRADWDTAARSSHTSVTRHRQIDWVSSLEICQSRSALFGSSAYGATPPVWPSRSCTGSASAQSS